ncbi:AAA family ATPase [Psychrobacter jeotgali]|uniref:AAA family ATPase n=1 Tax=Psychrobacter jeotgali TaxID=179010 RepID=UPI00191985F7|nr:ATP-binding protein [Psychrobacter jeotgali]
MITYIRFNNFYSYLEDTEVSFLLGKQPTTSDYDFTVKTTQDQYRLNKIMAIVGANGSGKTQILKAFAFLRIFMFVSMYEKYNYEGIPFSQYALSNNDMTNFELGFLVKNAENIYEEYRYELTLTKDAVVKESLHKKTSRQFSYIFIRYYEDDKLIYKHRDFIAPSLADDVKKNASLISYANLLDNPIAMSIFNVFLHSSTNVNTSGRQGGTTESIVELTEILHKNEDLKVMVENLLCQFDTGINHINIKEVLLVNQEEDKPRKILLPFGTHKTDDGEFELSFYEESNGTQSAYSLLGLILPVLHSGGIAFIDELDNDLHPHLLPAIFDLFRSSHYNPHNAQLIFSCHTPEVFNLLNKHQIYLVEKYEQVSEAWRLDEVEGIRNDDNLYAKYMAGAFDAIPNL